MGLMNFFEKITSKKQGKKKKTTKRTAKKTVAKAKPKKVKKTQKKKTIKKKTIKKRVISKTVKKKQKKVTKKVRKPVRKIVQKKKPKKLVKPRKEKTKLKELGVITHYYGGISVGIIKLKAELKVDDKIHIKGAHDDFTQTVKSIQFNHRAILRGQKGKEVGIKVIQRVHENDKVYII